MRFSELPQISSGHFRHDNSVGWFSIPRFLAFYATGQGSVVVEPGWCVYGVNPLKGSPLMVGREDCVAVMGWNPDEDYAWLHWRVNSWDFDVRGGVIENGDSMSPPASCQ